MRRGPALLAALAVALLLASCSHRDRANPLDAGNPISGGAPQGFNAIAGYVSARIMWTPRTDLGIDGYQLYRKAPFDALFYEIGPVQPASSSTYFDGGVINGVEYRYRLHYVIAGAPSERYAEDVATPGPVRAWAVDPAGGRLFQIAPDARDVVLARDGYGEAYSLAVTQDFGPVWVADYFQGKVRIVDPGSLFTTTVDGRAAQPFSMALDPLDGSAWVCDVAGQVVHIESNGNVAGPSLPLLLQPTGIATDPDDGDVWVTELAGNRVRRYGRDGSPIGVRALASPSRVAVDSLTGEAWVTSFANGWVWRISPGLVVLDSLHLSGPIGIALDWRRRTAWVADALGNEIVGLDMDTRAVRFRAAGLGEPRDAAVDLDRGEGWVVGRTAGAIYRFSATGALLARVNGLGNPYEVRLDRGH